MISMTHRCIFVRISKTASTSILNTFKSQKKSSDIGYFGLKHFSIKHYFDTYRLYFGDFFKFAFVRNPWDRIFSQYRYLNFVKKHDIANCSYRDWLFKCEEAMNAPNNYLFGRNRDIFIYHLTNQIEWISLNGEIAVDFVGRFENIEEDFNKICKHLNVDFNLLHENRSGKPVDYRTVYDDTMKEMVADWHARDLEEFGYSFD